MTAKGLLIGVDGGTEFWPIDSYIDIRKAVGGDFDWTSQSDIIMYCYEYALYELPVNPVATALYKAHNRTVHPLAGLVLVVGPADVQGDETDVPDAVVAEVKSIREELGKERIRRLAVRLRPDEIPQPQIVTFPKDQS